MIFNFKIDTNVGAVLRGLDDVARSQAPFAMAKALTRTAQSAQKEIPAALDKSLDRPTEFTKRGTFIAAARKTNLIATIGFRDRQAGYLKYQIDGGFRAPSKVALRLPGNVTLDAFGNIPKGTINKLIEAARSGKYGALVRRRLGVKGRRKGANDVSLFYGRPIHHPSWPVGIYRRVPGAQGRPGKLVPIVVFPKRSAFYRPRFAFRALVERVANREIVPQFDAALAEAIRTAR